MTEITATFTKLRSGEWGVKIARVDGYMPKPGEYVMVTKRDGSVSPKAIGHVMWSNDEVALATIKA